MASKQRTSPRLSTSSNSSTIQQSSKHAPSQTSEKRTPKKTVHEILSVPETTPLSKTEEKLHTRLLMRKRAISKDKDVIVCRTGGQPHYFMKLIKSRKPSATAGSPLKRSRSRNLDKIRMTMSGISWDATIEQQASELKRLTKS